MTQLNSELTLSNLALADSAPIHRLIVLVPQLDIDLGPSMQQLWELATAMNASVQFIGVYADSMQESSLRRDLVIMSAMVKDNKISTEAEVIYGTDWLEIVRSRWQPGDMVVCFAEQRVGLFNQPLSRLLQSHLDFPLYILSGSEPKRVFRSRSLTQLFGWIGSIGIIVGFFLLQIHIELPSQSWVNNTLFLISMFVEIWILWRWNNLFG